MYKIIKKKVLIKIILFFFILAQLNFLPETLKIPGTQIEISSRKLSFINPPSVDTAGISSASATLSNSRLSYSAVTSGSVPINGTYVTIVSAQGGAVYGDYTTSNIFPGDTVYIGQGKSNPSAVANVPDSTHISLSSATTIGVASSSNVHVMETGTITVAFYTASAIPNGGVVEIQIPAKNQAAALNNDGMPDTAATVATNGFDLNGLAPGSITCPAGFGTPTITLGASGNPHEISCPWANSPLPAGANLSVTIGTGSTGVVNPAPIGSSHTAGASDVYTVTAQSCTSSACSTVIDSAELKMAPVDGVFVSATVDESLTFTVGAVTTGTSVCNSVASVTSTAYSIPWGTVTTGTSYLAGQNLTVTTNADGGFAVTIEANDQMGKEGNACIGDAPAADDYSFTGPPAGTCIRDTVCAGSACSHTTSADWTSYTAYPGMGYSLANSSGATASFTYNETSRTFSAKQLPDREQPEAKQSIMAASSPVNGAAVRVCYRISIPGTQPAGYYYNKVKYTATPIF